MKTFFLTFAFCFVIITSWGQFSKFNVGVDLFPNISMNFGERGQYAGLADPKLSASYGIVVSYQLKPKVALESGLKYLNKGQKRKDLNQPTNKTYSVDGVFYFTGNVNKAVYNYNYLSIPLMIKFAFGESIDKGWFIRAGFAPAIYLSSQIRFDHVDGEGNKRSFKTVDDKNIRKTHLNLNYGLGYAFLIKEKYQISIEPGWEFMLYRSFHKKYYREIYHSLGINFRFVVL